jgi:hypothetical protein
VTLRDVSVVLVGERVDYPEADAPEIAQLFVAAILHRGERREAKELPMLMQADDHRGAQHHLTAGRSRNDHAGVASTEEVLVRGAELDAQ